MIFVTVGNYLGFPRLIRAVDQLKVEGFIQEDVLLQIGGTTDFTSKVCTVVSFLPPAEFEQRINDASVVVSHAGAGSMLQALRAGKVPIVMPRRAKYREHVDDHQLEGAEALASEGRIILIHEVEELSTAIEKARRIALQPPPKPALRMIALVSRAVEDLLARRAQKASLAGR
jgi:UDP-N-acetylglucosamine transferase subunit ALG13